MLQGVGARRGGLSALAGARSAKVEHAVPSSVSTTGRPGRYPAQSPPEKRQGWLCVDAELAHYLPECHWMLQNVSVVFRVGSQASVLHDFGVDYELRCTYQ